MADVLSRISSIRQSGNILSDWRYVGLGMLVGQTYPAAADTALSYGIGTSTGEDAYSGYDRFGRIVETVWKTGSTEQVHSKYGRDATGGIVWRQDVKAAIILSPTTQDDYYEYDGLRQVTRHDRGQLTPGSPPYSGVTNLQQQEDLTYDETGNWNGYQSAVPSLDQTREHNTANQITAIANPGGVVQPGYDPVGNMITTPAPGDWTKAYTCIWDAWNRLVEVKDGTTRVQANTYDARTRRIRKEGIETRDYYYDRQWRAIEERASDLVEADYVYSPTDRWNLIRRRRSTTDLLDETRYCLRDYLDPVAIIRGDGTVDERYGYEAFGKVRIMDANFSARTSSLRSWNWLFHGEFQDEDCGMYNYGYRYLDPQLGRWLSRDPLQNEGESNLYCMLANDLPNWFDLVGRQKVAPQKASLGKIQVIVKSENPLRDDCRFAYVSWSFRLSLPAPCDGYIIQKVKSLDTNRQCGAARPAKPPVDEFWEAFPVVKNSLTTTIEEKMGNRSDQSYRPTPWGTCGDYESEGVVTFVCNDVSGDLGTVLFNELTPGNWVSISPGGGSNDWGPGHDGWPGNRKSGPLPSTQKKPKWWDDSLNQVIPGRRLHKVDWKCCNSGRNYTDHEYEP